ncbi:zonular occludens toxin domain-containing protein [Enterovibrio paralichthyis]|uniref:zonular occludens toxin domain-containing protein n=1 Tax=Enterovibrio paralichthyis TaxID=2853805 RepID=UPI001C474B7B|nr:zonular occludens toxin domain-containing protein [Enterovibrio paralichthyis]MBV7296618.1 zonular occludens toxin [Enterovibrio paralichthyis]
MTTVIRHGPAGSFKTSYAVWFELLPALREGRIVVTNIEGMRTIGEIERHLGERFPDSAKLIRISSQTSNGRKLWQNWYNWIPLGSMILIDEVQDIFNKTVGFNMEKNVWQGLDPFKDILPDSFTDTYQRARQNFKPSDDYIDDIGEKIVADDGSIIMPNCFEEAFQRHRKYNWDIVLLTPNISKLGSEIKSVSEVAFAHKSKEKIGFWGKRRTRIFEHDPRSTTVKPTSNDITDIIKVPVAVHLLYSSTATGATSSIKSGTSLMAMPKTYLFLAALGLSGYFLISGFIDAKDNSVLLQTVTGTSASGAKDKTSDNVSVPTNQTFAKPDSKTGNQGSGVARHDIPRSTGNVGSGLTNLKWPDWFPFPDAEAVYLTATHHKVDNGKVTSNSTYLVRLEDRDVYVSDRGLSILGVKQLVIENCLAALIHDDQKLLVGCPPPDPYQEEQYFANSDSSA